MSKMGRLVEWRDEQGYGFIAPIDGSSRVFVHIRTFRSAGRRPVVGEVLRFVEGRDPKGRPRADSVSFVSSKKRRGGGAGSGKQGLMLLGLGVLVLVAGLMLAGVMPAYLAYLVLGMSALTFFVYARDKSSAEKRRRRTPESTLHLMSLLGGWPGALVAQQGFRHKNRKVSFQTTFWLTVVGNLVLLGWLMVDDSALVAIAGVFGS